MNFKEKIKKYLYKREQGILYGRITIMGEMLTREIDKMGNAHILKPSEYQIDEMIAKCNTYQAGLISYIDELAANNINIVSDQEYAEIKNLQIKKLSDCKKIANYYYNIGKELQRKYSHILYAPFSITPITINIAEALIVACVLFSCITIFRYILVYK